MKFNTEQLKAAASLIGGIAAKSKRGVIYVILVPLIFVIVGGVLAEVGFFEKTADVLFGKETAEEVLPFAGIETEGEKGVTIACDYAVYTLQLRRDTFKIANFEPVGLVDYVTPPPSIVTIYGKEANRNIWEGTFADKLKPYNEQCIILKAYGWERIGNCRAVIGEPDKPYEDNGRDDVPDEMPEGPTKQPPTKN